MFLFYCIRKLDTAALSIVFLPYTINQITLVHFRFCLHSKCYSLKRKQNILCYFVSNTCSIFCKIGKKFQLDFDWSVALTTCEQCMTKSGVVYDDCWVIKSDFFPVDCAKSGRGHIRARGYLSLKRRFKLFLLDGKISKKCSSLYTGVISPTMTYYGLHIYIYISVLLQTRSVGSPRYRFDIPVARLSFIPAVHVVRASAFHWQDALH